MRPLALAAALLALAAAAAHAASVRVAEAGPESVRLVVDLEEPASVAVNVGEAPFEWTALVESVNPAARHELVVGKLIPDRRYFYQLFLDGLPQEDVYSFRTGRSWASRRATIVATAELPDGTAGEEDAASRLLAGEPDAAVVLGAATADPAAVRALYRRSLSERPVIAPGGFDDEGALRLVTVSDVAVALTGDLALAGADGKPSEALAWAAPALAGSEVSCWRVVASSRELGTEAQVTGAARAAAAAGAQVLLARGPAPLLEQREGAVVVLLADADRHPGAPRHHARLTFESGRLDAAILDHGGATLRHLESSKDCPLPAAAVEAASADHFGDDDEGSSDLGPEAEDCDY